MLRVLALTLREPSQAWACGAGIVLGLAELCKFSMLVLYPAWLFLYLAARRGSRPNSGLQERLSRPAWLQLGVICGLSILVINTAYGFDGTGKLLGTYEFRSHLLTGETTRRIDDSPAANRFRGTRLASLRCPLPKHYLLGFDSQKWEEEGNFVRLAGGRLVQRGRWYCPLVTMAYKLPLGTAGLLGLGVAFWFVLLAGFNIVELAVLVPALFIIGLMCTQTGLNWPFRYMLPALPLLFIAIGRQVQLLWQSRFCRLLILACLVWNGAALFRIRPSYFAYGNELVGGPEGAQRVFLGSNFDWGAEIFIVFKTWADKNPHLRPLLLTYFGVYAPNELAI